jgi:polyisoprenoid-binding protein YceI
LIITLAATAAGDASIDGTKSTIVATFRQENVPVDAPFRKFSGHILYDPAAPAAAKALLDVDTGSFDLGSEDYNTEVRSIARPIRRRVSSPARSSRVVWAISRPPAPLP